MFQVASVVYRVRWFA